MRSSIEDCEKLLCTLLARPEALDCRESQNGMAAETMDRSPAFLRWMAYVSSAIYGLAWVRGDPMRIISDERQADVVLNRIAERRADCQEWQKSCTAWMLSRG